MATLQRRLAATTSKATPDTMRWGLFALAVGILVGALLAP